MSFKKFIAESQLLLEYDEEKTWKIHGPKIEHHILNNTLHDNHDTLVDARRDFSSSDDDMHALSKSLVMDHIAHTDPTPNKKYAQHVARIYGHGGVNRFEDLHSRMKPALAKFDDLAKRKVLPVEHRDIGKVKSLTQLEDIVDAHSDKMSGKQEDRSLHEKMKSQSTITDHDEFTHIIPHTARASAHFGKGTRWCTASSPDEDAYHEPVGGEHDEPPEPHEDHSMFSYYDKQGPLQIMIPKNPQYPGEKYQYHHSTQSMMNERDEPVGYRRHGGMVADESGNMRPDGTIAKTPLPIVKHIEQYTRDADAALMKGGKEALTHREASVRNSFVEHRATSDELHDVVKTGDPETIERATNNKSFRLEHITSAIKHNKDSDSVIRMMQCAHMEDNHVDAALNHPDKEVRAAVFDPYHANERAIMPDHIDKAMKDDPYVKRFAVEHPAASQEHISQGLDHGRHEEAATVDSSPYDSETAVRAAANPAANGENITKALQHPNERVRVQGARIHSPKFNTAQTEIALRDNNRTIRGYAFASNNESITPEHIGNAVANDKPSVVAIALRHPNASSENLHAGIKRGIDPTGASFHPGVVAMAHNNIDKTHVDAAINSPHPEIRAQGYRHKLATSDHLMQGLHDPDEACAQHTVQNGKLSKEHIDHALESPHDQVRISACLHPSFGPQHMDKAIADKNDVVVHTAAAQRMYVKDHHIDKLLDRATPGGVFQEHPAATALSLGYCRDENVIQKAMNHRDDNVKLAVWKSHAITSDHVEQGLNSSSPFHQVCAAKHKAATSEQITRALNHPSKAVRLAAAKNESRGLEHSELARKAEQSLYNEGTKMSFKSFTDMEALNGKSGESGIDMSIITEVYNRGVKDWSEDTNKTASQYAFNRVNSFLAGGFAAKLDEDLLDEVSRETLSNYIRKAKHVVDNTPEDSKVHKKSKQGIERAEKRFEPRKLDEMSPTTIKGYVAKAGQSVADLENGPYSNKAENKAHKRKMYMTFAQHAKLREEASNEVDISGEVITERELLDPAKLLTVKRRDTKSTKVIQRHNEKNKSMRDLHRTETALKRGFGKRNKHDDHFTDKGRHQLTDRWRDQRRQRVSDLRKRTEKGTTIRESEEYIKNRQAMHDAHSESARMHAGTERDPELRRLDLHRSKKHAHASRVLEILKSKIAKKKK